MKKRRRFLRVVGRGGLVKRRKKKRSLQNDTAIEIQAHNFAVYVNTTSEPTHAVSLIH